MLHDVLAFPSWLMHLETSFPLAKSLFCLSSGNEKLQLEKNSLPRGLNQNKTAQLTLPLAEQSQSWSPGQVRGAEHRARPLFLCLFSLAAAPGKSGMPCQEQGKESDQGRETCSGICAAHTGRTVPGKQGALLALGTTKGREVFSKEKQNFLCGQTCFAQFVGSELWELKSPL